MERMPQTTRNHRYSRASSTMAGLDTNMSMPDGVSTCFLLLRGFLQGVCKRMVVTLLVKIRLKSQRLIIHVRISGHTAKYQR